MSCKLKKQTFSCLLKKDNNSNKGFTLLEVLISVTILAMIIAPFLALFTSAFQTTIISQGMLDGAYISQNVFENLLSEDYNTLINYSPSKQLYDSDGDGNNDCYIQVNLYPDGVYSDMTSISSPSYLHINIIDEQIFLFGSSGTSNTSNVGTQVISALDNITVTNSNYSLSVSVQIGSNDTFVFDKKYLTCPIIIIVNLFKKTINSQDITLTLNGDIFDVYVVEYSRKTNHEELICSELLSSNIYNEINDMSTTLIHANVQVFDINDITKRIGFIEGTFEVLLA